MMDISFKHFSHIFFPEAILTVFCSYIMCVIIMYTLVSDIRHHTCTQGHVFIAIIVGDEIKAVNESDPVDIHCIAFANTTTTITWFSSKNLSQPLMSRNDIRINTEQFEFFNVYGAASEISICKTVRVRDEANYTCIATNVIGSATQKLIVQGW